MFISLERRPNGMVHGLHDPSSRGSKGGPDRARGRRWTWPYADVGRLRSIAVYKSHRKRSFTLANGAPSWCVYSNDSAMTCVDIEFMPRPSASALPRRLVRRTFSSERQHRDCQYMVRIHRYHLDFCLYVRRGLNHDPEFYGEDADKFRPERHLNEKGELKPAPKDTKDESHCSYGFGKR